MPDYLSSRRAPYRRLARSLTLLAGLLGSHPTLAGIPPPLDSLRTLLYQPGQADSMRFKYSQRLAYQWSNVNPDSALRYARLGLVLAHRTGQLAKEAHAQINLANVLRLGDDLPATQRAYEAGLRLAQRAHNPEAIGNAYSGLGSLAMQVSDLVGAQPYFEQAAAAYQSAHPPLRRGLLSTSYSLADLYLNTGQFPRARRVANQGLRLLTPADNPAQRAGLLFVVARLQMKQHQPDSAGQTFAQVRQLSEQVGDLAGAGEAARGQAEAALALHHPTPALRFAREAEELLEQVGNAEGLNEARFVKALAMHELRMPDAFDELRRHINQLDTLLFQQRAAEVSQLQARFDAAGRQVRIEKLEQQRHIAHLEAGQQAVRIRFISASAAALALMLLGAVLLYLRLRRTSAALAISEALARDAEAEAHRAVATKDQLMSIIGHDLRSPVATFQQVTPLLHHFADAPDPAAQHEIATALDANAHHLGALLDNLLYWARAEAGSLVNHPQALPVAEVLAEAIAPYAAGTLLKQVALTTAVFGPNGDLTEPLLVAADPDLLRTVLRNLVSNAVKFTPAGGQVRLRAWVEAPGFVTLEVRDTGAGIAPSRVAGLFSTGETTSTVGTAGEHGTGLGLPLSARFVRLLGSELRLVPLPAGQAGTAFRFELPLAIAQPEPVLP